MPGKKNLEKTKLLVLRSHSKDIVTILFLKITISDKLELLETFRESSHVENAIQKGTHRIKRRLF